MTDRIVIVVCQCFLFVAVLLPLGPGRIARGADEGKSAPTNALAADPKGTWFCISDRLLAEFAAQGITPNIKIKPADEAPGTGISGIFADRVTGKTFYIVQGRGIFQRAVAGKPGFERVDGEHYDAYYENAGPELDPAGKGICVFSIQGYSVDTASCISLDAGKTWASLTTDPASIGFDLGSVDWTGGGKTILAKRHHNGDLELSGDSGRTWKIIAAKQGAIRALGLIGSDVLLKGVGGKEPGLFRSADAGATWTKVADCSFANLSQVVVFHDRAYLATAAGVLISQDKGEHWNLAAKDCTDLRGPVMIGKDEKQLVVYSPKGFYESTDAGETWKLAVAAPNDDPALHKGRYEYGSWNPVEDRFYITHIAGKAFCYCR